MPDPTLRGGGTSPTQVRRLLAQASTPTLPELARCLALGTYAGNVNVIPGIVVPAWTILLVNVGGFTLQNDGIVVPADGDYKAGFHCNVANSSGTGARISVAASLAVNGSPVNPVTNCYIRNQQGHTAASVMIPVAAYLSLNAGDKVGVFFQRFGAVTAPARLLGSHLYVERIP